jgi:hypothetical protein
MHREFALVCSAGYQPAVRQLAGIPSHHLRQVTNLDQDLTIRPRAKNPAKSACANAGLDLKI